MANALELQANDSRAVVDRPVRNVMTPMEMIDQAVSQNASVETLEKLMALQERWEANQARKAFEEAISAAKAKLPAIVKNKRVDFTSGKGRTNYQYEDLASIMNQIGPILSEYGLSVRYRTTAEPNQPIAVTCIISHRMGHSEENTLMAGRDDSGNKNSIQAIGSTVTYLQRYTLKAALGLAAGADDDGAKADEEQAPPCITDVQASVIRDLVEQAELEIDQFCTHWKIEAIPEIPSSKFNDVVGSLRRRIATIAEKKVRANA